jgi:hypothetical protein
MEGLTVNRKSCLLLLSACNLAPGPQARGTPLRFRLPPGKPLGGTEETGPPLTPAAQVQGGKGISQKRPATSLLSKNTSAGIPQTGNTGANRGVAVLSQSWSLPLKEFFPLTRSALNVSFPFPGTSNQAAWESGPGRSLTLVRGLGGGG